MLFISLSDSSAGNNMVRSVADINEIDCDVLSECRKI